MKSPVSAPCRGLPVRLVPDWRVTGDPLKDTQKNLAPRVEP